MPKPGSNRIHDFFAHVKTYTVFLGQVVSRMGSVTRYKRETMDEMYRIGSQSFPLVMFGGLFVGLILALETGHRYVDFGAKSLTGYTVVIGVIRELGPVITGLLLAARTAAKNVSEIGGMRLSDQIDALQANGEDPIRCLVVPRTIASVVMFVPLTAVADASGILGGLLASVTSLYLEPEIYWNSGISGLLLKDVIVGFSKPVFFGFFIATISSYFGMYTRGGTTGLGRATINAVVNASLFVLVIDLLFTKIVWEFM